uniref:Uncharacterized protein n=1 Tax=Myripristis murdjan TaxID=586833 RepID=A0A667Y756_9TELE
VGESQVEHLVMVLSHRCTKTEHRAGDAVVAVKQLPPQELISGDSQPLSAGQTKDLQHQAVRQKWATLHSNILGNTPRHLAGCAVTV